MKNLRKSPFSLSKKYHMNPKANHIFMSMWKGAKEIFESLKISISDVGKEKDFQGSYGDTTK